MTYYRIRIVKMERPLIQAVEKSDEHAVKKLLAAGADPNSRDRPAQNTGFLAMLKKIIHRDASEHAENYNSALMIAARKSDTDILLLLLQMGAKITGAFLSGLESRHGAASSGPATHKSCGRAPILPGPYRPWRSPSGYQ
jgi:hypothetical protein